jgi:hypothetical protein
MKRVRPGAPDVPPGTLGIRRGVRGQGGDDVPRVARRAAPCDPRSRPAGHTPANTCLSDGDGMSCDGRHRACVTFSTDGPPRVPLLPHARIALTF